MRPKSHLADIPAYVTGQASPGSAKLSSNESALGPSPRVFGRIRRHLETIHRYPDPACTQLRSLLARKLGLDPSQIVVGNGSDEILMLIAAAYIGAGDNIVTADSTFPQYRFTARIFQGETRSIPLERGRIRVDRLAERVDARTRAVYVCNPNNPTGTYVTRGELEWLLRSLPKDVLVVVDEAYREYADAHDFPDGAAMLGEFPNLIVTRTFSKAFGLAGLRIGYALAHPDLAAHLRLPKFPFNVNHLAQVAAMAALEDEEHLLRIHLLNREGKAYLYRHLDRLEVAYFPSQGNFVFALLGRDYGGAAAALNEAGVSVRPFVMGGGEHALRITIGTSYQNRLFVECLEAYLEAARKVQPVQAAAFTHGSERPEIGVFSPAKALPTGVEAVP